MELSKNDLSLIFNNEDNFNLLGNRINYDLKDDFEIIKRQRELKIRQIIIKGYDIIHNIFFVKESVLYGDSVKELDDYITTSEFETFDDYYKYLSGDIYSNANYFDYEFPDDIIKRYNIDMSKISRKPFINETINDCILNFTDEEKAEYQKKEKNKSNLKKWIEKFNKCNEYMEFHKTLNRARMAHLDCEYTYFFFYNYLYNRKISGFDTIIRLIRNGDISDDTITNSLCCVYGCEKVYNNFHYDEFCTKKTNSVHKKRLKRFIELYKSNQIIFERKSYFDNITHFYCVEVDGYEKDDIFHNCRVRLCHYFETFEEMAEELKGDLRNCDLSDAILLDEDFSKYKIDQTTFLPNFKNKKAECKIYKGYDRKTDKFYVIKKWYDENKIILKSIKNEFHYIVDFIYFLQADLSNADLLHCDGLINLKSFDKINFTNSILTSKVKDKFGIKYEIKPIKESRIKTFDNVLKFEKESALILSDDEYRCVEKKDFGIDSGKIYYITDLHLLHRLQKAKCKTFEDRIYEVQKIVDELLKDLQSDGVLLIGGDVASDKFMFELFLDRLMKTKSKYLEVFFVLGNHELWSFDGQKLSDIVSEYSRVIRKYGMYLIHNEIMYINDNNIVDSISAEEIKKSSKNEIREKLIKAKFILFGGLGFTGYNKTFNADNGIYLDTITREQDISESEKFNALYNRVCETLYDKNVIILTHTPKLDWSPDNNYENNFIYLNGHTHRNYYYDKGGYRIYADNQTGYYSKTVRLKYFYYSFTYDIFTDYEDGIYNITPEQYSDFYLGKRISMSLKTYIDNIIMLKNKGVYCFIYKNKDTNCLYILRGGLEKKLPTNDINYYYRNLPIVFNKIKRSVMEYEKVLKNVSKDVKSFGGEGTIHGCIVDIDYFSHIYVDPFDYTYQGYWASNIKRKYVYPTIRKLIKEKCSSLYLNYVNVGNRESNNSLVFIKNDELLEENDPVIVRDTMIYKINYRIQTMQRVKDKILTIWTEDGDMNSNIFIEEKY